MSRSVIPYNIENDSLYFQSLNRNKKSLALDLKTQEGRKIFHDLVSISQAVFNNLRGDLPRKLGLDYESLKSVNPRIVCVSLNGFGSTGPKSSEPAYDYLIQGYAGWMSLTGEPNSLPTKTGLSLVDFSTSYAAALGLMVGLFQANKSGQGCDIEVSLYDVALSMFNYLAAWNLNKGYQPKRQPYSAHPTLVPSQLFATKDDFIIIMCNKEKFWKKLCEKIGKPEWVQDERFADFRSRYKNKEVLIPLLQNIFKEKKTMVWLELLKGHVPCAPVYEIQQALSDPDLIKADTIVEVDHPQYGKIKEIGCPIKITSGKRKKPSCAPSLGQHTEEILIRYLGFNKEEIERLRRKKIVI